MTTVTLRQATEKEYAGYRARSVPMYADELLAEAGAAISRVLTDDEPHRGRGLGRATMLAVEQVDRSAGHRFVRLNMFGWNTGAQALYRSLGYRTDAIQMTRPHEEPT